MIISNFEQGSPEWHQERVGKVTGSNFSRVMTASTLKPSKDAYIYELAAERASGMAEEGEWDSYHMRRGKELEPEAVSAYEFENNITVQRVGFCTPYAASAYGCSPDGLIGEDGGLEIKCPELKTHIQYTEENKLPSKYKGQVYGFLYVTKRNWIDFMSYHRDYEAFVLRVTTDDPSYIKWRDAWEMILPEFLEKLEKLCMRGKNHD